MAKRQKIILSIAGFLLLIATVVFGWLLVINQLGIGAEQVRITSRPTIYPYLKTGTAALQATSMSEQLKQDKVLNLSDATVTTQKELQTWLLSHYDFSSSSYNELTADEIEVANPNSITTTYEGMTFIQSATSLSYLKQYQEWLKWAFDRDLDVEKAFLHFSKDQPKPYPGANNWRPLENRFWLVITDYSGVIKDVTADAYGLKSASSLPASFTQPIDPNQGDVIYFAYDGRFSEINFVLSQSASAWQGIYEFWNGSSWDDLTSYISSDTTSNLQDSGKIEFMPPPTEQQWKRTTASELGIAGNDYENTKYQYYDHLLYFIRLRTINAGPQYPIAQSVEERHLNPWIGTPGISTMKYIKDEATREVIPGWDSANDKNNDGVIDNGEFNNLVNQNASARFKYQSRPKIWSFYPIQWLTNVGDSDFQNFWVDYGPNYLQTQGSAMTSGISAKSIFLDVHGLSVPENPSGAEYLEVINNDDYTNNFIIANNRVADELHNQGKMMACNSVWSSSMPPTNADQILALKCDIFYNEFYFGYESTSKKANLQFIKALNDNEISMRLGFMPLSAKGYSRNQMLALAMYLNHAYENTYFAFGDNGMPDNTQYWCDAYEWIGNNAGNYLADPQTLTKGFQRDYPVGEQWGTGIISQESDGSWWLTDSTANWSDNQFKWYHRIILADQDGNPLGIDADHPEGRSLMTQGNIQTKIKINYGGQFTLTDGQTYEYSIGNDFEVEYREYKNLISLARFSSRLTDDNPRVFNLPNYQLPSGQPSNRYWQLNSDGVLSGPTTQITLRNPEGAILVKESGININIVKSIDKNSASSGETLIYTLTYTNNLDIEVTNAKIEDTIPIGTSYVSGSASNGGTLSSGKVIWNLGTLAPGASSSVQFQVKIE